MGKTEQIQFRHEPDGAARPKISPDYELGHIGPPVQDPGPSDQCLPRVEDFILGCFNLFLKTR